MKNKMFRAIFMVCMVFTLMGVSVAQAQTDITGVITSVSGYWTAVLTLAIAILLFSVGRAVVKKIRGN